MRSQRGAGTVMIAGVALCLVVLFGISTSCIAYFTTVRQAERVAEIAALAGAGAALTVDEPCEAARRAAEQNHSSLSSCIARGEKPAIAVDVEVAVELSISLPLLPHSVMRRATAGVT